MLKEILSMLRNTILTVTDSVLKLDQYFIDLEIRDTPRFHKEMQDDTQNIKAIYIHITQILVSLYFPAQIMLHFGTTGN